MGATAAGGDASATSPTDRLELDVEAAVGAALARNRRLHRDHITVTAGPQGLVTLTGTIATQALRREVELTCWTVPAVWTLHDRLVVGRSTRHV